MNSEYGDNHFFLENIVSVTLFSYKPFGRLDACDLLASDLLVTYSLDSSYTKANNYLVDEVAGYPDS